MDQGLIELDRAWIEVKGSDAKKFLNALLTNDINKLDQSGCYALLLTPKGKIIADCFCYPCEDYFGIDCATSVKPALLETLKKYLVFQKVEILDKSDHWRTFAILEPDLTRMYRILSGQIWVLSKKLWNLPCHEIWVKKEEAKTLKKKLNLPEISPEEQERLRIESGTPLFGIDFDQNTIPQEACLYDALSFTKGCYVGQEIVARLEHRGHVAKQLVQLIIEGKNPPGGASPARGEKIFSGDGKEIGRITSSIFSQTDKKRVALGTIRYPSLNLTEVVVGGLKAEVKSLVKNKVSK